MGEIHERSFEHAWRYFELHAGQRMTLFNFFLVLVGLSAAGIATSLQGSRELALLGIFLGLLLTFVSLICWKLDQRVSFLMKRAESAIAALEIKLPSDSLRLFQTEPAATLDASTTGNLWTRHWTYGRSFRITFSVIAFIGVLAAIVSAVRFCTAPILPSQS